MADRLTVKDLGKPLDGEYEFELVDIITVGRPGSLTNREAHVIKLMSGLRAGEIVDGIVYSDNDLLVALAVVILARAGKTVNEDALWDAKIGCLDWDIAMLKADKETVEEAEADPPKEPAEPPGQTSANGGTSSAHISGLSQSGLSPIGPRDSATSAEYVRVTSET